MTVILFVYGFPWIEVEDGVYAWDGSGIGVSPSEHLQRLVEQIEYADQIGLDVFGVGEHHRKEFLDSVLPSS